MSPTRSDHDHPVTYGNVLQFLRPLSIGEDLLTEGLDILSDACANLA